MSHLEKLNEEQRNSVEETCRQCGIKLEESKLIVHKIGPLTLPFLMLVNEGNYYATNIRIEDVI